MNNWLKMKLRRWLGVEHDKELATKILNSQIKETARLALRLDDLVSIGVDVHFKGEPHMILIYSRINGGQLREIQASFDNIADLNKAVKEIAARYGARQVTVDMPPIRRSFWEEID